MAGNSILWNNCSSNDSQHRSTVFWWAYFAKFSTPSKDSWEDQFLSLKKRPRCSLVFPKNWLQNLQLLWAWSVLSATSIIQSRNCGIFCYIHQKFYAHTNDRHEGEFQTSPMYTKLVTSFATWYTQSREAIASRKYGDQRLITYVVYLTWLSLTLPLLQDQCWSSTVNSGWDSGFYNEDFTIFIPVGYGFWQCFCFCYHLGLHTMQKPSYVAKIALVSIWLKTDLTQVNESGIQRISRNPFHSRTRRMQAKAKVPSPWATDLFTASRACVLFLNLALISLQR